MEDKARHAIEEVHKKRRLAPIPQQITPKSAEDRLTIPVSPQIRSIFWDDKLSAKKKQNLVKEFFYRDFGARLVRSEPPIVYLETFLDAPTLELLLEFVERRWAQLPPLLSPQETDQGKKLSKKKQMELGQRTSRSDAFRENETVLTRHIAQRARRALGLQMDAKYLEFLQVVRYQEGQEFQLHHDSGTLDVDDKNNSISVKLAEDTQDTPLRSFTIFVYLNSVPERNGGATVFPLAKDEKGKKLSVQPKAGAAAMWANVTEDGEAAEIRTIHSAEPILGKGVQKTGMNIWFTFREFTP